MAKPSLTPESLAVMESKEKAAKSRNTLLIAALAGISFVEAFTIMQMIPLKERVPYFVEVEQATGRVVLSDRAARTFSPDENNKRYFIKEWVQAMFAIDPMQTKDILLPKAKSMTRGKATNQFDDWLTRDQTIQQMLEKPDLSRGVEVKSISFVPGADKVAIVRATFKTESASGVSQEERKVITMNYALVPPQTDDDVLRNPIGLFITDFHVDSEVVQ